MYVANTAITLISRFLIMGLGMAMGILVARLLGPADKGLLATIMVVTGIAGQFANPGMHSAITHFTAKTRAVKALTANALWWSLTIGTLVAALTLLVYRLFPGVFKGIPPTYLLVALMMVPAILGVYLFNAVVLGLEKLLLYNLLELIVTAFLVVGVVIALVLLRFGVLSVIWLQVLAPCLTVAALIVYFFARGEMGFTPDWPLLRRSLGYGVYVWASLLLSYLVLRFDMLFVNYYCGGEGAGWYSVAVSAGDLLMLIPVSVGTTLFPRISALRHEDQDSAFARLHQTFWLPYLLLCLGFGLAFPWFVRLLYGAAFLPAAPAFYALLPGIFFLGLEILIANNLAGRAQVRYLPHIWTVGFVINTLLTVWLVKKMGLIGAAYASSLSYFLVFVLMFVYHQRHNRLSVAEQWIPRRESFVLVVREIGGLLTGIFRPTRRIAGGTTTPDETE
ncbi:MAG TPA: oligosaccharide flippase family protein [bacterium]|nr:oligosaccharide flippase family protein [bacterium]